MVQGLEQVHEATPYPPARAVLRAVASGAGLRCEVATEFDQLHSIASEWDGLWERDCRAEIFQSFAWAKAWWRAYGEQCTQCSCLVYEGDALIGIVPLVRRDGVIQFLGTPQADYADLICEESRTVEVLTAALEALARVPGWSECALHHLARHSRLVRHWQKLPGRLRRRMHVVASDRYPTIVLRRNREEVFKQFLGKNHTRRRQNKLQKAGRVEFRFMETKAEAQQYLSDFFRHHVRRRAVIGKDSACAKPEFHNFLRALVDEVEPVSRLRFGVLELDGRPLAWGMGFQVNGKFLFYQHTFDLDMWDYSPGEVALWNLLQYARQNVTREFDFGKGEEAYKNRFTNYARETCSVFVERPGLAGSMLGWRRRAQGYAHRAAGDLKRRAQEHRPTLTFFRSLQTWTAETLQGARQAKKDGALLKFAGGLGGSLVRRDFRRDGRGRNTLDVFVAEKIQESTAESAAPAARDEVQLKEVQVNEVQVHATRLGELVDLVLEPALGGPAGLGLKDLPKFRQRLKQGDRAYLVREGSQLTLLSWIVANVRANGMTAAARASANQTAVMPAMLMDECMPLAQVTTPASYRGLLFFLKREAAGAKVELLIQCPADRQLFRGELQRQGFVCVRQTIHYQQVEKNPGEKQEKAVADRN
jgi:CelD/BcsL family acetyltransferase involved in cellulose biosynthesis